MFDLAVGTSLLSNDVTNKHNTSAVFHREGFQMGGSASSVLEEDRNFDNLTSCRECIYLTLKLPTNCRLNTDLLSERIANIFNKELLRDLCNGCPLEMSKEET